MLNYGAGLATPEAEALAALSVSAVKGESPHALPVGLDLRRLYKLAKSNYIICAIAEIKLQTQGRQQV